MSAVEETKTPGVMTITLIVVMGTFMAVLDASILNVALPKLMVLFSVDTKRVEWVLTAYMLVSGAIIPITSYVGDRFGYRTLYTWSLASFTLGSLLCGLAWSNETLVAFRVLQGVGGGLIMPAGMALLLQFVPKEKMGAAMGIYGLAAAMAPSFGPTVGGMIVESYSWRWLFMINIPVGVAGVALAQLLLPETPRKETGRFDLWGLLLASGSAFCYLLALSQGESWGWTSYSIVMLLFTGTMMLAMLIFVEWIHPEPMVDIHLFRYREFACSILMGSGFYLALLTGVVLLPIYLQSIRGYSAVDAGWLLMPQSLAMAVAMIVVGKLYDKLGARPLILAGMPFIIYGTYQFWTLSVDTPISDLNTLMIIRGIGLGMSLMPIQTAGLGAVPSDRSGAASAMVTLVRNVAGAIGIALATVLMENRQALHLHRISEDLDLFAPGWKLMQQLAYGVFAATGDTSPASEAALTLMYAKMKAEAAAWAIGDVFFVFAAVMLLMAPLGLLFRKQSKQEESQATVVE